MTVADGSPATAAVYRGRAAAPGFEISLILMLIAVMPLIASPPMAAHLFDISGFKIPNILAGLAFLAFVNNKANWRVTGHLQKGALIAFSIYLVVLTTAFLRSLANVSRFHSLFPESYHAGIADYWQSYYVLPVLLALSFIYVLQRMCSPRGLQETINAISLGMFAMSCAVILLMLGNPAVIADTDPLRGAVNALTENYLGMHYNGVSTLYAITAPLLLYMAFKRGSIWWGNLFLAIVAVLLLKSRTGIFTFAGMGVLTLIALGRTKVLFALAPIVAVAALAVMGNVLIGILSIGISKSGISIDLLLSGREQSIWLPLIAEWTANPNRFWTGAGLFGIMTSDFLYSARSVFAAGEAHNFYLEFFLDNGIVVFSLFLCALIWWLIWSYRLGRRIHSELYWVLFLCAVSFLVTGFTGRRYFPEAENILMFPIMAALINVARLKLGMAGNEPVAGGQEQPASPGSNAAAEIRA